MQPDKPSLLDAIVDSLSRLLDALGLNGSRLRWKWRQKRFNLGEQGMKTEMAWRSAQGQHKMCPECRQLVDRKASECPSCGENLGRVSTPGAGRAISNLFPGLEAITSLILLVNGAYFLLLMMMHVKNGVDYSLFGGFDWELSVRLGAGLSVPYPFPDGVTGGEWWRLVTPLFMHDGLIHIFFNSMMLLQLGPIIQNFYGARLWPIYLACGIAGSIASQWTRPVTTLGASGAIFGLIGLLVALGVKERGQFGQAIKSMMIRLVMYMIVISILIPNIDHRNHFGGFAMGFVLGIVVPRREPSTQAGRTFWSVMSTAGVLLVLAAFAMVARLNG